MMSKVMPVDFFDWPIVRLTKADENGLSTQKETRSISDHVNENSLPGLGLDH